MSTVKTCSIKLLNKTYEIRSPKKEAATLQLAAEKLNEQLLLNKNKFKNLDDTQNFMLAALHICHELITCQKMQEQQRSQVAQFINSLESKITKAATGFQDVDA